MRTQLASCLKQEWNERMAIIKMKWNTKIMKKDVKNKTWALAINEKKSQLLPIDTIHKNNSNVFRKKEIRIVNINWYSLTIEKCIERNRFRPKYVFIEFCTHIEKDAATKWQRRIWSKKKFVAFTIDHDTVVDDLFFEKKLKGFLRHSCPNEQQLKPFSFRS